ncbi:MAG: U32 family peptidase [Abditibacteriota bacterium]|nr:U32 family peptidase [Abditibacteriota bacterium]
MPAELLAPAGDMQKLEWAVEYGADAVYFGLKNYSLRSYAGNFSPEEAARALQYLHEKGRKGYVTLNIYPFTGEYAPLLEQAAMLRDMGADAFIVADFGLICALKKAGIETPVHVSTQANTVSAQAALAYADMGCARVNLARELSFEQILEIKEKTQGKIELEVFIHGSVCFSYSGRCAISDYLTGRRANRGECAQPCRWSYCLMEEKRPGSPMPVFEDERGLYLFNSRDLALWRYARRLSDAGIASLKIEGRMKTIHYVASVLYVYRRLLDGCAMGEEEITALLSRISNRGYTEGFMKGGVGPEDYKAESSSYLFTSVLLGHTGPDGMLQVNNSFEGGETAELLTPSCVKAVVLPPVFRDADGNALTKVNNDHRIYTDFPPYSVLRRVTG